MAKMAKGRAAVDPQEDLARWTGARQKYRSEYEKLLTERKNEILSHQVGHGPKSDAYAAIHREFERNDSQLDRLQAVIRRPINKFDVSPWIFWLFALALAVFEAPVNKFLFDYAIQGSNLTSYMISTVFAILLLLLAHMAGKCLRQVWSEYRKRIVWSNLVIALISIAVLVMLVCILTIGRARYSAGAADPGLGGLFTDIGGQVGEHGFLKTLLFAFSDVSALILFTINLGGIAASLLLGYFSHDPDKDLDHAEVAHKKTTKRLTKIQNKYAKARAATIQKFSPDLAGTSRNYSDANDHVIRSKTMLGLQLDEWDRFTLETLDNLADESAENEDVRRNPTFNLSGASKEVGVDPNGTPDDDGSKSKLRSIK